MNKVNENDGGCSADAAVKTVYRCAMIQRLAARAQQVAIKVASVIAVAGVRAFIISIDTLSNGNINCTQWSKSLRLRIMIFHNE